MSNESEPNKSKEPPEAINWNAIIWNATVLTLSGMILGFGAAVIYCTPPILGSVVKEHGIQIIVLTLTLLVIVFLLTVGKISKEAGLSLLGAIIGYAFGKG